MSYKIPDWAPVHLAPIFSHLICPECEANLSGPARKAWASAQTAEPYHPAHIPLELVTTCDGCEEVILIPLSATVNLAGWPRREKNDG